ncbi:DMT family transporter [Protaetiibacter intestinalis]|uniref:DMT family transporter n=1 Tax=Protaetiibacter intestinalis TaxID=2419774 RepID=A0A387B0T9_9MICO|nr:DMT family transporter [Protaetiibacter intestinalis]AYF97104.1 DMT family transporter [Protaetiibacter intestinalis]
MVIVLVGLASAVVYGVSDFFGGLGSRRIPPLLVSLVSFAAAAVPIAVLTPLVGSVWSAEAVWLGVLAGVAGAVAIWAFYAALAIGPMSVISPTTAAVAALIPAIVGIARGERFSTLGYVALAALVVAAVLLGITREQQGGAVGVRAVVLAVASGIGFGGYNVVMEWTAPESEFAPLLVDLVAGALLFAVVLVVLRLVRGDSWWGAPEPPPVEVRRPGLLFAVGAGLLMAVANALLVWGLHQGQLAIMGVLASLYPLGTVLLALTVLRERLTAVQVAGVVLALAASAALAFG